MPLRDLFGGHLAWDAAVDLHELLGRVGIASGPRAAGAPSGELALAANPADGRRAEALHLLLVVWFVSYATRTEATPVLPRVAGDLDAPATIAAWGAIANGAGKRRRTAGLDPDGDRIRRVLAGARVGRSRANVSRFVSARAAGGEEDEDCTGSRRESQTVFEDRTHGVYRCRERANTCADRFTQSDTTSQRR